MNNPSNSFRLKNKQVDSIYSRYECRVKEVINSYGLNVDVFNTLSKQVKLTQ